MGQLFEWWATFTSIIWSHWFGRTDGNHFFAFIFLLLSLISLFFLKHFKLIPLEIISSASSVKNYRYATYQKIIQKMIFVYFHEIILSTLIQQNPPEFQWNNLLHVLPKFPSWIKSYCVEVFRNHIFCFETAYSCEELLL